MTPVTRGMKARNDEPPTKKARLSNDVGHATKNAEEQERLDLVSSVNDLVEKLYINPATIDAAPLLSKFHGSPPAWAHTRTNLCESCPRFKAVQGAAYTNQNKLIGFLIDKDSGERAYADHEIIITRAGGGYKKNSEGNMVLHKDQEENGRVGNYLFAGLASKDPVFVVMGNQNELLHATLPYRYNVMAFFVVTDVWYEKSGKYAGLKLRLQKVDLATTSWWARPSASMSNTSDSPSWDHINFDLKPETYKCTTCKKESPRIYNEGWICLQRKCRDFWKINGAEPPATLTYHASFLSYRLHTKSIASHIFPINTAVNAPRLVEDAVALFERTKGLTTKDARRGIVCPRCQMCQSRTFWEGWKCDCGFEQMAPMKPISINSISSQNDRTFANGGIEHHINDGVFKPYRVISYVIPNIGSITHFISNDNINACVGGPNELLSSLHRAELGLERHLVGQARVAGTLTGHFAVNYGTPYKYIVSVDSKAFKDASDDLMKCLGRLSWATEKAVVHAGHLYRAPNELLVLGYFEGMKIGYHDDGESTLGPTIATLSLGGKSKMTLRMKYGDYFGLSRIGCPIKNDAILEGCKARELRQSLKRRLEKDNSAHSRELYDTERRQRLHAKGEPPVEISMDLRHGDLVVMHGELLQKHYEHAVTSQSTLRYALTARFVKTDNMSAAECEKGEFKLKEHQIYKGN
ncbi:hypothetical protein N7462_003345 [Penicillium macrosclerotiorum]|uniref:uncharacterized protein n=1 Tax=Penicillium macrosclerotiorum TaxID=303699 RepID=UPI0025491673|nr:uncharacterized protein N7462_003345 [Penicillium macrosclerotiorum]KAJ5688953.1 hypothetical protein N7462_003345 [Penicillium macrosclerotiorum]